VVAPIASVAGADISEADSCCPLCGGCTTPAFTVGDRNRGIGHELFRYRRCRGCLTYYLVNVPADLGSYYPSDYYGLPAPHEIDRAARAAQSKLEFVRPFASSGSLIEVGAGFGLFSRAARNAGFDVTAIEMDARCCHYLESVVGVRAICTNSPETTLPDLPPARVVALWHVLEHLPEPLQVLTQASARLEPGGILVFATPNPDALQFRLLGRRWAHVDAPRHLYLLPYAMLREWLGHLGLEPRSVTTADVDGRHCNRFGWEYALRRAPARRPSSLTTLRMSAMVALSAAPFERRGLNGATYTAVFVKGADSSEDRPGPYDGNDGIVPEHPGGR